MKPSLHGKEAQFEEAKAGRNRKFALSEVWNSDFIAVLPVDEKNDLEHGAPPWVCDKIYQNLADALRQQPVTLIVR
ncbi:MAG: hypothetical protein ACRD19_03190 [Terriglobia bacterium]